MNLLRPKIILGVVGVVMVFLLISLAQEMNRRLQVQRQVQNLQRDVQEMQRTIIGLENLNQYFKTDAYQERLAREKLNYQAPGEKVVLIPEERFTQSQESAQNPVSETFSLPERWWRAFFVPEPLTFENNE